MTAKPTDLDNRSKTHRSSRNTATASTLTIAALVFAAYSITAMSSSTSFLSSPLQAAYAQEEQQQEQSNVADKAARMSAAVDGTLRYYARAIGAQYTETDIGPIAGAANVTAIEDVTIPSVPIAATEGNITGIVSMADYLIAKGLLDKSYELFLETAREMRNVTIEDVNEIQTTLLQLNSLIEQRSAYNLAEDVVQNLQGHLQRTLASTEEFTSGAATTTTTTGGAAATDGGGVTANDSVGNNTTNTTTDSTSTTPSDATTATETGTTSDTTTTNNDGASVAANSEAMFP